MRRFQSAAFGIGLASLGQISEGQSTTPAMTVYGLTALSADELAHPVRVPVCRAEVRKYDDTPLMLIVDGSSALVRYGGLSPATPRPAVDAQSVWMARASRKESGGGYIVVYGRSQAMQSTPTTFVGCAATLRVGHGTACPGNAGQFCRQYDGVVELRYRWRDPQGQIAETAAPGQAIVLREWCEPGQQRIAGMFWFPGWLDWLGGWVLRSK